MAARTTMANLIARLRRLIGDPPGASQVWSDDDLQDALDARRQDVRYLRLTYPEAIASGGAIAYTDFYAPVGDWEADVVLTSGTWAVLTPTSSDLLTGHWTFATDQTANLPVTLTGKTFDLYAAAADMLEQWVLQGGEAALRDRREGDVERKMGQVVANRQRQADRYRGMARPGFATMVRGDVS